jgi:hypothetical protein
MMMKVMTVMEISQNCKFVDYVRLKVKSVLMFSCCGCVMSERDVHKHRMCWATRIHSSALLTKSLHTCIETIVFVSFAKITTIKITVSRLYFWYLA